MWLGLILGGAVILGSILVVRALDRLCAAIKSVDNTLRAALLADDTTNGFRRVSNILEVIRNSLHRKTT